MRVAPLLIGQDRSVTGWSLGGALLLGGASTGGFLLLLRGGRAAMPVSPRTLLVSGVVVGVLAATGAAYANDGLVSSLSLASAPSLGYLLALAVLSLPTPAGGVLASLGSAAGFGVAVGTPAFIVGTLARRLERRLRR
jgi:hypothetical protein